MKALSGEASGCGKYKPQCKNLCFNLEAALEGKLWKMKEVQRTIFVESWAILFEVRGCQLSFGGQTHA